MSSREIVIVGAGPGGLAAAILLAAQGLKVTLLERQAQPGGRTSTLHLEGFKFDIGATFFLYPRVLDEILQVAGTRLEQEVELVRLDPQYRLIFGAGGQLDATGIVEKMKAQIAALSPADGPGFERFLTDNRAKLEAFKPCLENPFMNWRDLLNSRILRLLPLLRPHESVETYLRRFFSDERVRLAFCFQSKYLGMSPFRCPSLFSILAFLEYEYGVFHPVGGCGAISVAMARVAERLGVQLHLSTEVTGLRFEGRRAIGVETATQYFPASAIVVNADFAHAMQTLVPDALRRRWTNSKLERKKFSCSTFMLYLGIKGRYDLPHHTIYIARDYENNLADIERRHVLSADPSFYVQNVCTTDADMAPKGFSTLYVLVPVTHRHPNVDWSKIAPDFRERVLRQLAKAGYHDVKARIVVERMTTPVEWETKGHIFRGATFNLAHTLDQMLHLRPHNRFEDVDGVYLVGGGTHPGSGLPVIYESARITSKLILDDLGMCANFEPRLMAPVAGNVHKIKTASTGS